MVFNSAYLWSIFGFSLFVFFTGFFYRVSIWLKGAAGESEENNMQNNGPVRVRSFRYLSKYLRLIFSRDFFRILKSFILDGIIHVNLFKDSKLKWFIHIFMFWGLLSFTVLSVFHMISVASVGSFIPPVESSGFIRVFGSLPNSFTAVAMELTKLSILFGAFLAVVRFLFLRKKMRSVEFKDKSAGVIISIIIVLAFLYEAALFSAANVPLERSLFAPGGFVLTYLFKIIEIKWWMSATIYFKWAIVKFLFYSYITGLLLFVAFIPWGKYSHMVFGPFVAMYNKYSSTKKH